MDRLKALRVFVAVGEAQGFAPAARRLGLSPPAVTRAVATLEAHVGTRLLRRTTRQVRLTEAGQGFLADCRRILAALDEAEAAVSGVQAEPRGTVAVTAPAMFGRMFVAPIVVDFLARHPHVGVRTLLLDRVVDLIDEGIDVAVRIARLPDSSLTAIRVGSMRRVVCASPAYLAAHGTPAQPADLADHEVIDFATAGPQQTWSFAEGRRSRPLRPPSRLTVNTAEVALAAAVAGRGLARLLSYQVEAQVRAGTLRIVLERHEPPALPVHVVHAEGRRAGARVRAFVDFAVERLRAESWLA